MESAGSAEPGNRVFDIEELKKENIFGKKLTEARKKWEKGLALPNACQTLALCRHGCFFE